MQKFNQRDIAYVRVKINSCTSDGGCNASPISHDGKYMGGLVWFSPLVMVAKKKPAPYAKEWAEAKASTKRKSKKPAKRKSKRRSSK